MDSLGDLVHADVQAGLTTVRLGRSLVLKSSTASTNDDARAASLAGAPDGHVVVADAQTRGRGARGRTWVSPPGQDLYLSIVAAVPVALEQLPPLTLAVGLAVADTLDSYLGGRTQAQIKWPNDLWLQRQKCAGILVEGGSMGERPLPLVIGIGVNVNRRSFPDDLDTPATSLALVSGLEPLRSEVLARLLNHVESWIDRFVSHGASVVVSELSSRLALRGEQARCDEVEGVVCGVAASGALRMQTAQGVRELVAGTLRPLHR